MFGLQKHNPHPAQASEFDRVFNGMLFSLMSWQQLAEFWPKINREAGWYLYAIGEVLPPVPSSAQQVEIFIREVDVLLRRDHEETYCGIVYADNLEQPSLVKIYDPHNLGVSCGSSANPPLPGWIMSIHQPTEMAARGIIPANRQRWWQSLATSTIAQ